MFSIVSTLHQERSSREDEEQVEEGQMHQPSPSQAPRYRRASWTSLCIIVTRLTWMAHRFVSSKRWFMKASAASCNASTACDCYRSPAPSGIIVRPISRTCMILGSAKRRFGGSLMGKYGQYTRRENGSLRRSKSVERWYLLISFSVSVPGRYRLCFRGFGAKSDQKN